MAGVKGRSGRRPLSPAQKASRQAKRQYAEAITEAEIPPPAPYLNRAAIDTYYETYRLLLGVATLADARCIAQYAYAVHQWEELHVMLAKSGYLDCKDKPNPYFAMQNTLTERLMKLQTKLGLSPADRRASFPVPQQAKEEQGPTAESLLRMRRGEEPGTIKLA